jgi:hypothetical protein
MPCISFFASFCQNKKKAPGRVWQSVLFNCPYCHRKNQTYIAAKHHKHIYVRENMSSTRAVIRARDRRIVDANDYYPFGLKMPNRTMTSSVDRAKESFTGKELDSESGLYYFRHAFTILAVASLSVLIRMEMLTRL